MKTKRDSYGTPAYVLELQSPTATVIASMDDRRATSPQEREAMIEARRALATAYYRGRGQEAKQPGGIQAMRQHYIDTRIARRERQIDNTDVFSRPLPPKPWILKEFEQIREEAASIDWAAVIVALHIPVE